MAAPVRAADDTSYGFAPRQAVARSPVAPGIAVCARMGPRGCRQGMRLDRFHPSAVICIGMIVRTTSSMPTGLPALDSPTSQTDPDAAQATATHCLKPNRQPRLPLVVIRTGAPSKTGGKQRSTATSVYRLNSSTPNSRQTQSKLYDAISFSNLAEWFSSVLSQSTTLARPVAVRTAARGDRLPSAGIA